jgi:hypothetical protein
MNKQIKCYCGHTTYCDCGPLPTILEAHIEKAVHDIRFNGCQIPESLLRLYFETACGFAKLEGHKEMIDGLFNNNNILGTGQNDQPNQ